MSARRLLWPAALVLAVGCSRPPRPAGLSLPLHTTAAGTPVVKFSGQAVTSDEVRDALAALSPAQRARFANPEQRKVYAEEIARFRILANEAAKEGLASDPEVVAAAERVMVHKLLGRALETVKPTDAEVQAYYDAHKSDFERPETVRTGQILLKAQTPADRTKAHATLDALLKKVRALPPTDAAGFSELARHYSEDPRGRMFGGDMRYATREILARELGQAGADAAFQLGQPGQTTVVDTDRAVVLVRLLNHTQPFQPTLEQVKPQILGRLSAERRNAQLVELVARLEKEAGMTVDEKALAAIPVDPAAAPKPLGRPMPDVFALPAPARPAP